MGGPECVSSLFVGRIQWRQVVWGVALQFIFGLLILRWNVGREIFSCLGHKVSKRPVLNRFHDVGYLVIWNNVYTLIFGGMCRYLEETEIVFANQLKKFAHELKVHLKIVFPNQSLR